MGGHKAKLHHYVHPVTGEVLQVTQWQLKHLELVDAAADLLAARRQIIDRVFAQERAALEGRS